MKKTIYFVILLLILLSALAVFPEAVYVTFNEAMKKGAGTYRLRDASISLPSIPASVEEFIAIRNKMAREPMGGYALFVAAMIKYGENKGMGIKFFTIAMDKSGLEKSDGDAGYKGYKPGSSAMYLIRQMDKAPYLGNIYIAGTAPDNRYKLPAPPWIIKFNQATIGADDSIKLYAFTTSGNRPRPIALKRNDKGIWKAYEFSSLFVGVSKKPKNSETDDL